MSTYASPSYLHSTLTYTAAGEYETARLAAALAKISVAGDLIRLVGDLGMGKSTFSRHFVQALGHVGDVPSPTYTLVQTYADTRFPLAHVDCYRMKSPEEMDGLGLEGYRKFGILLVEWPEKGSALAAGNHPDFLDYYINSIENSGTLTLEFTAGDTPLSRKIILTGSPSWQRRFGLLEKLESEFGGVILKRKGTEASRHAFLQGAGLQNYQLAASAGDWSGRSYARITLEDGTTRMLMDSPPPLEGVEEYAQVAEYYRSLGLKAAKVYAKNEVEGYLLTEDFGNTQLLELVKNGDSQTEWYKAVADGLVKLCQNPVPATFRHYAPKDWWVEVMRFVNWYMPFARGRACTLEEYAEWQGLWMPLYAKVMALPQGLMMWDCQTPNLMVLGDEPTLNNIGWIDIQDARISSVAQDLALFLRNIRSEQNDAREAEVLAYVAEKLGCNLAELQLALDIASLHHSCRILGGLTRVHVRDGNSAPAKAYLERTWEVARQSYHSQELQPIIDFMRPHEAPGLARLWKETNGRAA